MAENNDEKLVFIVTHAAEHADKCSLPFVLANAALAMDTPCSVILQSDAVLVAQKGYARHVKAHGLPPLSQLMDDYIEQGGRLYVCKPCFDSREMKKEELLDICELVTSGFVIDECTTAKNVVCY